jgi:tetratricopeptide (TPR) repeat protein
MGNWAGRLAEGLGHHRAGQWPAAEAAYRAVLAEADDQPNALHLYGVLLSQRGDLADAAAFLLRADTVRPRHGETLLVLGNVHHRAGRAAAAMGCWREVLAIEPGHIGATLNLAGCLRAAQAWREAADVCRDSLRVQPEAAALWSALAACLLAGGAMAPALTAADAALALDASDAEAWLVRGTVLARNRAWAAALAALTRAAALDPACARAALNHGNALVAMDRLAEAEAYLRRAIALDPQSAEALTSMGFFEASRHRLDEALVWHDRALVVRPEFAEAHSNRAATLLLGGDYARGWPEYEWRKRSPSCSALCWQSSRAEWQGEDLMGRTLLVFCEQGAGDTILCARYLPLLASRGARLVLVCAAALSALLQATPDVVAVVARGDRGAGVAEGQVVPPYDVWIDQMSLPLRFGTRIDTVPSPSGYLCAEPARVRAWRRALPAGRKVGLVWAGNAAHSNDARRSMTLDDCLPLLALTGVRFVSLQCGAPAGQAARAGLYDPTSRLSDYAETAALIACLDLVIAVDTSVAHLAGALGVPCWLLLPYAAEWRWMVDRADSPWYASLRLFRQQAAGDWGELINRVGAALTGWRDSSSTEPC